MDNPFAANGNDDFDWGGDQVTLSWIELNSTSFFVLFKLACFKISHSVPQSSRNCFVQDDWGGGDGSAVETTPTQMIDGNTIVVIAIYVCMSLRPR